jgi:hypothetical protein
MEAVLKFVKSLNLNFNFIGFVQNPGHILLFFGTAKTNCLCLKCP